MRRQAGFTLIELLVVILVIAILAAIAIPVFLNQREKGWESQSKTALRNASTAIETYATDNGGDYSGLDNADSVLDNAAWDLLEDRGLRKAPHVAIRVDVDVAPDKYCVTATHSDLPAGHPWAVSTFNSDDGSPRPVDADTCPGV